MMMDELAFDDSQAGSMLIGNGENKTGIGIVNLKTFLLIMEKSAW